MVDVLSSLYAKRLERLREDRRLGTISAYDAQQFALALLEAAVHDGTITVYNMSVLRFLAEPLI